MFSDFGDEVSWVSPPGGGGEEEEEWPSVAYRPPRYAEPEMRRRARDFYALLNGRRSVRHFSDKPVPLEVMQDIVRAAGASRLLQIGAWRKWGPVVDRFLQQNLLEIAQLHSADS